MNRRRTERWTHAFAIAFVMGCAGKTSVGAGFYIQEGQVLQKTRAKPVKARRADAATFEYPALDYTADRNGVHGYDDPIAGADVGSFVVVLGQSAKDSFGCNFMGEAVQSHRPAAKGVGTGHDPAEPPMSHACARGPRPGRPHSVWLVIVAASIAVSASSSGKPRTRRTIKAEVDEAVLRFEATGVYLACGCGCCGDKRGARTVCLSAETGSLREVVEDDRLRARSPRCASVGCARGIRFVKCGDLGTRPLRRSRDANPQILAACKQRGCSQLLALKDGAGMIGGYVLGSSAAEVAILYVDIDGNLLGSFLPDAPEQEKQAAQAIIHRLRKELPSEQKLCCEGGS